MRFPNVNAKNLLRQDINFPEDFQGEYNILFIPFQQWQQKSVDSWIPFVEDLEQRYLSLRYYELPTIRSMNFLSKTLINEGMRAGIPDKKSRERTVTLYLDKKKFRKHLDLRKEDSIHVLLVDKKGNVVWRDIGDYSQQKGRAIEASIRTNIIS